MAHLSLSLLGPFQVTLDGQPVTSFKSNKVRALLAYLAVEADRPHRREVLAGLLWPDWPDRDALSNLRYALSNLRRVIGDRTAEPPFLLITRDTLQFNTASDHSLDVADFERQIADSQQQIANQKDLQSAIRNPQSICTGAASWRASQSGTAPPSRNGRCLHGSRSPARCRPPSMACRQPTSNAASTSKPSPVPGGKSNWSPGMRRPTNN